LLWRFFTLDPLEQGIISNENAIILNSIDTSRNWEGIIIAKGKKVELNFYALVNGEELTH